MYSFKIIKSLTNTSVFLASLLFLLVGFQPVGNAQQQDLSYYLDESMIKTYKSYEEFFNAKKKDRVILMTTKASKSYVDFKFKNGDTLLFGRESSGVPQKIHKIMKYRIKVPMVEKKRSLNLASSVAIILSENIRQTKYLWTN